MIYYKKFIGEIVQYHACSHVPPVLDGLIEISKEEYEAELMKLLEEDQQDVLYQ